MIQPKDIKGLELVEDGKVAVRPVFAITLFTDQVLTSVGDRVLTCYERFLQLCPESQLKHYLTETMDQHKATTRRTFTMLPTWLKKGAPAREEIYLDLISGDDREAAPEFRLVVSGGEDGSLGFEGRDANLIRLSFPANWGEQHAEEMRALVIELGTVFPFTCGHAGFALEWSAYFEEEACSHAYKKGMRHPGFDIFDNANDEEVAGHDSIKTVSWLNLLGAAHVERLGGTMAIQQRLPLTATLHQVGDGVMIAAGATPEVGDVNRREFLPAYSAIYEILSPIAELGIERTSALEFGPGDVLENTIRWLRRFASRR